MNWVELGWTPLMNWVGLEFFLPTMVGWIEKSLQPDLCTPLATTIVSVAIVLYIEIEKRKRK